MISKRVLSSIGKKFDSNSHAASQRREFRPAALCNEVNGGRLRKLPHCYALSLKKLTLTLLAILCCITSNVARSTDFQKGLDATQRGDYATALSEWMPFVEQGNYNSQFNLGLLYDKEFGVPQDHKSAVKWYRLVAEEENTIAQFNLGWMYEGEYGVPQDYVYAYMWGSLAASNGSERGRKLRDHVAEQMTSADISAAKKRVCECVSKQYKWC